MVEAVKGVDDGELGCFLVVKCSGKRLGGKGGWRCVVIGSGRCLGVIRGEYEK